MILAWHHEGKKNSILIFMLVKPLALSLALPYMQSIINLFFLCTSLNPVPNAQVCVYLTVHVAKLQLQTTFPKPLYI